MVNTYQLAEGERKQQTEKCFSYLFVAEGAAVLHEKTQCEKEENTRLKETPERQVTPSKNTTFKNQPRVVCVAKENSSSLKKFQSNNRREQGLRSHFLKDLS